PWCVNRKLSVGEVAKSKEETETTAYTLTGGITPGCPEELGLDQRPSAVYRPHEGELACVKDPEPLSPALPCAGSTRPFGYWYRGIVCPTGRSITPSISSVLPPSLAFLSEERVHPHSLLVQHNV